MKRQLIRFACHNCGARLAVPVSMGGRSDRCPKCQEVITAPLESEESSLPPAPAEKVTAPKKKTTPPAAVETAPPPEAQPDLFHGLRPSLLDDFLGGPLKQEPSLPESPPPAPPPPPEFPKEAPKLKRMVAKVPEPPAPPTPPSPSAPEPPSIAPLAPPAAEEDAIPADVVLSAPKWTPPSLDPEPEHEKAEDALQLVGMGHVLEHQSTSQSLHTTRQGGAPIGVGLMHLGDLPGRQRRRRWRLIAAVGISLIVIVDFTLWVFWSEIKEWWYTPAQVETEAHPLPKPKPASDAPAKTEAQQNKKETDQHLATTPPVIAKKEESPTPPKKEETAVAAKKEEPKPEPPPEKMPAPAPSIVAANKTEDKKTLEEKSKSPATPPPAPIPSLPPGTLAGLTDLPTSPAPSTVSINKPGESETKLAQTPASVPEKKEPIVAANKETAPSSPAPIPTPEPKSASPAAPTPVETEKPKPAPDKKEPTVVADVSKPTPSPLPPASPKAENHASAPPVPATPLPVLMPSTAGGAPAPIPLPGLNGNPGTLLIPPVPPPAPTTPAPVTTVKPEPENEPPIVVATAPVMTRPDTFAPPIPPPVPGDPSASSPPVPPSPENPADNKTLLPPADANVDATPQPKVSESSITAAARPATEALKKFLFAANWQERLKYCQKPGSAGPLMEKYYKSRPDGPVRVGQIELKERYAKTNGRTPYCMFELSGGVLKQPVLALVEEPAHDTPRVDWEAFVEFKDRLLWEFLERPGAPPQKFRVMVRRKHYFDKDVPHMDSKEAFMIVQPGIDAEGHVFVPMGSKPARQLAQHLGWNATISAVLELAWRKEDSHRWVEIAAVSGYSWKTSTSED